MRVPRLEIRQRRRVRGNATPILNFDRSAAKARIRAYQTGMGGIRLGLHGTKAIPGVADDGVCAGSAIASLRFEKNFSNAMGTGPRGRSGLPLFVPAHAVARSEETVAGEASRATRGMLENDGARHVRWMRDDSRPKFTIARHEEAYPWEPRDRLMTAISMANRPVTHAFPWLHSQCMPGGDYHGQTWISH